MRHLFDFGISQEDPLTELDLLDIRDSDHLLCIASGGEVPLSIFSLRPGVKITAVDISPAQLQLCRLKLQAAIALPFPMNGLFLGYGALDAGTRRNLYFDRIRPGLSKEDHEFWSANLRAIEKGVVHFGRFEGYIRKLRVMAGLIIGKKNSRGLLNCKEPKEQEIFFDTHIAPRRAVQYLFRIAFHPAVYKNRGLNSQGLIHARTNTGDIFFRKFRSFCTATPAGNNYFLHYFLTGSCQSLEAFPEYLREANRKNLAAGKEQIIFKQASLQVELAANPEGHFNKIHLSNIGDWMSREDFQNLLEVICKKCTDQTIICNRFLQKNHLDAEQICNNRFSVSPVSRENADRFPFYSILLIRGHGKD